LLGRDRRKDSRRRDQRAGYCFGPSARYCGRTRPQSPAIHSIQRAYRILMKTGQHIDALNSAIAEAKATLRDMHECDGAVADLVSEALAEPWTYTTTSKAHVIAQQLAGNVKSVKRKWSIYRLSKCPSCGYYAFNGQECYDCGYTRFKND